MTKPKPDNISSKPLDPTADFEEYVGGETDNQAGITKDYTRSENEASETGDTAPNTKDN